VAGSGYQFGILDMARIGKALTIILIISATGFLAKGLLGMYVADVYYERSQALISEGNIVTAAVYANEAILKNPLEPNYYRGRARVNIAQLINANQQEKELIKLAALNDLKTAYDLNTNNLVTIRNAVPLYYFLAAKDLSQPGSSENVDEKFLPVTRSFYQMTKRKFPNDVGVYVLVAKYEKRLGLTDDFNASLERIKQLRPDLLDWQESLR
jgi:hypothetical protein